MAHTTKTQTALPERPKPPSTEEMLEDLKTADDKDAAFTALRNIVDNAGDDKEETETAKDKLNKNLEETHTALLADIVNVNSDISKEFEKVKQYLEMNVHLETSQESLQKDLNTLVTAKDEIESAMKQLQDQLGKK